MNLKEFFTSAYLSYKPDANQEEINQEFIRFINHIDRLAIEYYNSPYYDRPS